MPINAYTGLMGSGKTYECVSNVIVPAIAAGRNVVTNIENINAEEIYDYCEKNLQISSRGLGQVFSVTNEQVLEENFFCHGTDADTVVNPGDLVCLDEAWRFYDSSSKIHEKHRIFFREHRHYVNPETKVSCDIVLMVQDITDLQRNVRCVVEFTFRFRKLKSLGLNKNYSIDVFEGYRTTKKSHISHSIKKYDPQIFKLYSSYTGGSGVEKQIDKRTNIFSSKKVIFFAFLTITVFIIGFSAIYSFFNKQKPSDEVEQKEATPSSNQIQTIEPTTKTFQSASSTSGKIVGSLLKENDEFYFVDDGEKIILISRSAIRGQGLQSNAEVGGKIYTNWISK